MSKYPSLNLSVDWSEDKGKLSVQPQTTKNTTFPIDDMKWGDSDDDDGNEQLKKLLLEKKTKEKGVAPPAKKDSKSEVKRVSAITK